MLAFLFRRRTLFLGLGAIALLVWAQPTPARYAGGLALGLLGEAIRIWAAGTIHKSRQVTTIGPYAWVRHPLYFGSFLVAVGFVLMCGRWEALAFGLPLFVLFHGAAVVVEEKMLLKLFGDEYADYSRRVPQLFPRMTGLATSARGAGGFSWDQVLHNREPLHVIAVVVLWILFGLRLVLHR